MNLYQFFRILRAHYSIIFLIIVSSLVIALLVSLLIPKKYTAQVSLLVDARTPDPVSGAGMSGVIAPSYMATQVDIIGGDMVAERVVKILKLDEDSETNASWLKATQGRGSLNSWIGKNLQSGLSVQPARESNVINIIYKGNNPDNVAKVANAFAQAYLDTNLSLKTEPARLYATWFDEQTKVSRTKLEDAQSRLSDYQQKAGIVSSDERVDYETAKLAQISTQLTSVQGETTDSQSKRNGRGDTVAEVMQSSLINGLKSDIARLEAKVNENNVNLGVNHPLRQRAEAELSSLRNRLSAETNRISASIETAYRVGKDRERELQSSVNTQKIKVLGLNKQRDELNVYRRDVEAAQRAYETVSQSASQTRLQSLTNQTNTIRLNTALVPIEPSGPKLSLNLLIAAFVGTLLGIGFALIFELMNRRVRSSEDLMQMLDLPVLANISSSGSTARLISGSGRLALPSGSSV